MPRDSRVYLDDILEAIRRIGEYTEGFSRDRFLEDLKTQDSVTRNLTVIGEAVKKLPQALRERHPGTDWRRIAGLRDILVHEYAEVDYELVWDIVENKLPALKVSVVAMLAE